MSSHLARSLPKIIAVVGLCAIAANVGVYLLAENRRTRDKAVAVFTPIVAVTGIAIAIIQKRRSSGIVTPTHPMITSRPRPAAAAARSAPPLSAIAQIRELLGPPPRRFDRSLQRYLHLDPPSWLTDDPELAVAYTNQDRIRRDGKVVWAAHVQANRLLFSPGDSDHPASMVFSEDPWFDDNPDVLCGIGHDLFALKNSDHDDPECADFSRMLTNERIRAPMLKVPRRFTDGRSVFHSSIVIPRKHLPKGVLCHALMPVWIDPAGTGALLLVPAAYWPSTLLMQWDD